MLAAHFVFSAMGGTQATPTDYTTEITPTTICESGALFHFVKSGGVRLGNEPEQIQACPGLS